MMDAKGINFSREINSNRYSALRQIASRKVNLRKKMYIQKQVANKSYRVYSAKNKKNAKSK